MASHLMLLLTLLVGRAQLLVRAQLWVINTGSQFCRLTQHGMCVAASTSSRSGVEDCTFSATVELWSFTSVWSPAACSGCGTLTVSSVSYRANDQGPSYVHLASGAVIRWQMAASSSVVSTFELCGSTVGPPNPPPPPVLPTNVLWTIQSGSQFCSLTNGGTCVTDGPGNYGNNEACTVVAARSIVLTATEFDTERNFDFVSRHASPPLLLPLTHVFGLRAARSLPSTHGDSTGLASQLARTAWPWARGPHYVGLLIGALPDVVSPCVPPSLCLQHRPRHPRHPSHLVQNLRRRHPHGRSPQDPSIANSQQARCRPPA
jgi:hypothetical protein